MGFGWRWIGAASKSWHHSVRVWKASVDPSWIPPQDGRGAVPVGPRCSLGKNKRKHRFAPSAGMRCGLPVSSRQCGRCLGWSFIYADSAVTLEPASASPNRQSRNGLDRHLHHDIRHTGPNEKAP
jgi:hypothetical protein